MENSRTHRQTHTHTHTHARTSSLSFSLTHTPTHKQTHTLSLSRSPLHTHANAHLLSFYTHTHTEHTHTQRKWSRNSCSNSNLLMPQSVAISFCKCLYKRLVFILTNCEPNEATGKKQKAEKVSLLKHPLGRCIYLTLYPI